MQVNIDGLGKLASSGSYRRYAHRHAIVDKRELMALSSITHVDNILAKCGKKSSVKNAK
ncbi:hypothetical protein [Bradyrhizobium sp. NC92]|uniref:hypothetical protein n=1 Tax=Bradyrhizobium sp. (strain NC92) TaxID=55395 RepID=UPI0021A97BC3|nr:hypothetical protein [Bradyrhizobium sp. NC92]UWU67809.1 hypothetical protein N2602_32050 [Bradyrhizobium sp. NC92]